MNVFRREIRANLKSLLIWGIVVTLFTFSGLTEFSAYEGNPDIMKVVGEMPAAVSSAFSFGTFNLATISGFYGVMFSFLALIVTVAAAMWGSDIIAKEERDKTVEFALSLPITREKLITGKILAAVVHCFALLLITGVASLVATAQFQPDSGFYEFLFLILVALFLMQMVFLSVGIFLGCALKRYQRAGSVAVSLLLGTYFLSIISGLSENLEFLRYFSPFAYFDPATLLNASKIDVTYVLLSLAIIVVCITGGYITYARRDLYI